MRVWKGCFSWGVAIVTPYDVLLVPFIASIDFYAVIWSILV